MKEHLPNSAPESLSYSCLKELPFAEFDKRKYSIYVIDYNWTYLFVNQHAKGYLGELSIVGKNIKQIWQEMPANNFKPVYEQLKEAVATKTRVVVKSMSPLTHKWVEIQGSPLSDCYYFTVKELPDKESLISDLRSYLNKK